MEALKGVDADAPEVHLARAIGLVAQEKSEEAEPATQSLDQAYRLIAEQGAQLAGQDAETLRRKAALADLRARVAFNRGLVAAQKPDWAAAVGEFQRVLELDPERTTTPGGTSRSPTSNSTRPAGCATTTTSRTATPATPNPSTPKKAEKRVLCGADEDWYSLELPAGTLVQVQVKGKITATEDEDDTREVTLALYWPEPPRRALQDGWR